MDSYRYSEHPPTAYMLDCPGMRCEVQTLLQVDETDCEPFWNYFWLSNPALDRVVGAGKDWWRVYAPGQRTLSSVIKDVAEDFMLHHHLSLHPLAFVEWWAEQRHADFRMFEVGGQSWADAVGQRAQTAADRLTRAHPPIVTSGNVLVLSDFRKRA